MYRRYNIHPTGIIHVGANDGYELPIYTEDQVAHVVWVEAIPSVYERLLTNIANYTDKPTKHYPIQALIADENGKKYTFHLTNNGCQSSSIYEPNDGVWKWEYIGVEDTVELESRRLDDVLHEHQIDPSLFDYLVVDVQGSEDLVLKSVGEYLDPIKWIEIEVSTKEFYKGGVLFPELSKQLNELGFKCLTDPIHIDDHCDVIFQRV